MKTTCASSSKQRIPVLFQEIIKNDKRFDDLMSSKVVPMGDYREIKQRKTDLIRAAERMYTPQKGDGKGTA